MHGIGAAGLAALLAGVLLMSGCTGQRAPVVSREPPPPERGPRVHEVERGDTLYAIAWRYDTTVDELARLNGLGPPYLIRVGQRLRLEAEAPGSPAKPAAPAASSGAVVVARPIPEASLTTHSSAPSPTVAPTPTPAQQPQRADPEPATASARVPAPAARPVPPRATATRATAPQQPVTAAASDRAWLWPVTGKVTRQYDSDRKFKGINIISRAGTAVAAAAPGQVVYAGDGLRGYGQLIIVKHDEVYLSAYAHNRVMKVREGDRVARGQVIGEVGGDAANPGRLYFEIRKQGKPIDPTRLLPTQ